MEASPLARQLDLIQTTDQAEIRRDYLHDYYVLIAPKRRNRPFDVAGKENLLVETDSSPRLDLQPAVDQRTDKDGAWLTRVVDNKYPALTLESTKAYGKQEIVIDTPLRNTAFGELPVRQVAEVLKTYQQRSAALYDTPHIKYVSIFRNDGKAAGASLAHAHSQIVALPLVPPRFTQESLTIESYVQDKGHDPYQDIIDLERQTASRIISDSEHWLCFTPYAPIWHMEVWWLPKRQFSRLIDASESELDDLANSLAFVSRQLASLGASYNLSLEDGVSTHHRFQVKIRGREIAGLPGGLELATGVIINPISPEAAADWYRRGI